MARAINNYLLQHAANELHVISMLVGGPVGNIKVNPRKAFAQETELGPHQATL